MGLDMYLTRKSYVKNWDYDKKMVHEVTVKFNGEERKDIRPARISYIVEDVAYWRKANQIHRWFMDNTEEESDGQHETYVSKEQLQDLVTICKVVLNDRTKADELLPTQEGLFFGEIEYGDGYFDDLEKTIKMISQLLKEEEDNITDGYPTGEYYYHASW